MLNAILKQHCKDRRSSDSKYFQAPVVALSAGWIGCTRRLRAAIMEAPSTMVELLGRLAQMESETTSDRRPCGKMSVQADPASQKPAARIRPSTIWDCRPAIGKAELWKYDLLSQLPLMKQKSITRMLRLIHEQQIHFIC